MVLILHRLASSETGLSRAQEAIMTMALDSRRGTFLDVTALPAPARKPLVPEELSAFGALDLLYRALCAILYNYVPMSGHPGGSISSGRFVAGILFDAMDYDVSRPDREDADVVSYAAGHKAMGLYSMWALRDEIARLGAPELLPDVRSRLRLEDLLGFRRNPVTRTPLFARVRAKALDGHPTPATPFVRLATGASGVGFTASVGLALAARDYYGRGAPRIHVVEGEGGLTPGRVAEALAAAGTARLDNLVVHLDWNQASIDSERVCRDDDGPGDYVQWSPPELFRLHDWNVVLVPDGMDFQQVLAAQRTANGLETGQPTAIVYRTVKGWRYGIEGRASHGAGHKLCSEGFYEAVADLVTAGGVCLPSCEPDERRCERASDGKAVLEECFWEALGVVRQWLEKSPELVHGLARRLVAARNRLDRLGRRPRPGAPRVESAYELAARDARRVPPQLALRPGSVTTLRGELGRALQHLNQASGGAFLVAAADLLGSTSVNTAGAGFPPGYWNAASNPAARLLSVGGICEDAIAGVLSGLSAFGRHVGVGSSYAAFIAPLGHIAARLHGIGAQARRAVSQDPYRPMILVCAHAGLKTGEDGPTHADPQALQLLQGNFPPGVSITLTPWEPQEIWTLLATALARRPALIAPFVTRPSETVLDRVALGLAPPEAAETGLYLLRRPGRSGDGTIVLQESAVTYTFVQEVLPLLERDGIAPWVYYVASAELFDLLPDAERRRLYPEERAREAMGITGFTLPTIVRWVASEGGRQATLHPYARGHFLGSGQGEMVLAEAGLDAAGQYQAIRRHLDARARERPAVSVGQLGA
jgi:transketolase